MPAGVLARAGRPGGPWWRRLDARQTGQSLPAEGAAPPRDFNFLTARRCPGSSPILFDDDLGVILDGGPAAIEQQSYAVGKRSAAAMLGRNGATVRLSVPGADRGHRVSTAILQRRGSVLEKNGPIAVRGNPVQPVAAFHFDLFPVRLHRADGVTPNAVGEGDGDRVGFYARRRGGHGRGCNGGGRLRKYDEGQRQRHEGRSGFQEGAASFGRIHGKAGWVEERREAGLSGGAVPFGHD